MSDHECECLILCCACQCALQLALQRFDLYNLACTIVGTTTQKLPHKNYKKVPFSRYQTHEHQNVSLPHTFRLRSQNQTAGEEKKKLRY